MKKLFTLAIATVAAMTANAGTYTVYNNGAISSGITMEPWNNLAFNTEAVAPGSTDKCLELSQGTANNGNFCGGLLAHESDNPITGPLHSATLSFKYYATTPCKITIRLTGDGKERNQVFTVSDADANTWQTKTFSVAADYADISKVWNENTNNGEGYLFGIVVEEYTAESKVYVNQIEYLNTDDAWVKPAPQEIFCPTPNTPELAASDVLSLMSGAYTPATEFNIGNWGQSTQYKLLTAENNAPVGYLRNFNYIGWELHSDLNLTDYNYMHVEFYPMTQTPFGFTPISRAGSKREIAWVAPEVIPEQWNVYDVPLTYWKDLDLAQIFQVKFDQGNVCDGYLANVYFYKKTEQGGDDPVTPVEPVAGNTYEGEISNVYTQNMRDGNGDKEYPYNLKYSITSNEDGTLSVKAVYNWTNGAPIGIVGGYVYFNNEEKQFTMEGDPTNGTRTFTSERTFTANENVSVKFSIPVALGNVVDEFTYTVGSKNDITDAIESIGADNAPVEYYNLQGMKIASPENGIFIRRQGNKVSKVIL